MTQDEIIRMAREAGFDNASGIYYGELERFAAIVAAHERETFKVYVNQVVTDREMAVHDAVLAEREACAKVCEPVEGSAYELGVYKTMQTLAATIRSRNEK